MDFYKDKYVAVTGGASFIGSHLAEQLVIAGARVKVIDDFSSGSQKNLANVANQIEIVEGDLRYQNVATESLKGQELLFHLANIHGGRGFIETHPGEISQNFLIDGNVFLAAKDNNIERICYTSSACAYPTQLQTLNPSEENRYLEESMADPFKVGGANADGVYGWAKFMGELALKSYHEQFGMKGVSCRLFTVYGPRENESHAIIAFIARALLKQDPYIIWGSGQQDRNFTFVSDVVNGLMLSMERITDCSAINIGTSEITKIIDAVKTVCEILNYQPSKFEFDLNKPEGVAARAASTAMQRAKLDWEPEVMFKVGIEETINWYVANIKIESLQGDFNKKLMER